MARSLPITDARKRDSHVLFETDAARERYHVVGPGGAAVRIDRLIRTTADTSLEALHHRFGGDEGLSQALVKGDPEVDLAAVGRRLSGASRVWLSPTDGILYSARSLQVVYGPDGVEKSRADFLDVEATVVPDGPPLVWSGRLMAADEVVRKFVFSRKLRLRHVDGLTYDFLHEMARTLQETGKLLFVGAGPKGQQPIILTRNGSPWRGFLDGRVEGSAYRLVLHLTNLELKAPPPKVAPEGTS